MPNRAINFILLSEPNDKRRRLVSRSGQTHDIVTALDHGVRRCSDCMRIDTILVRGASYGTPSCTHTDTAVGPVGLGPSHGEQAEAPGGHDRRYRNPVDGHVVGQYRVRSVRLLRLHHLRRGRPRKRHAQSAGHNVSEPPVQVQLGNGSRTVLRAVLTPLPVRYGPKYGTMLKVGKGTVRNTVRLLTLIFRI